MTTTTSLESPLYLGRYRKLRELGHGNQADVHLVWDEENGQIVALKRARIAGLLPEQQSLALSLCLREGRLMAGLQHPSIPRVYAHGLDQDGIAYLVIEYIDGATLAELLAIVPGRRVPLGDTLDLGIQLCDVLSYLHAREPQIIFRDLQPANILLTADGRVHLIDLGIAREGPPSLPSEGDGYGVVGYAPPEQYPSSPGFLCASSRSDLYALGVILHEALSGENPCTKPKARRFSFRPLPEELPPLLRQLVSDLLARNPQARPSSADLVRETLRVVQESEQVTTAANFMQEKQCIASK